MNLSENNTSNITYGILDLISLQDIDLSNNNITNLPLEKLLNIKKTIKIDLTENNIPQDQLDKLRNHPYVKIEYANLKLKPLELSI
ncbi:MAG: hypothetical protein AABZ74_03720 [Cyanobacteriota bacterium]